MIKKSTVFILGAGASADFDYPLGFKLREMVIENLSSAGSSVTEIANVIGPRSVLDLNDYEGQVVDFAADLLHDASYSIDAFLERFQNKYLLIGKMAIAQVLANCENHDKLFKTDNWYRHLHNRMKNGISSLDSYSANRVSFITFNYDRSLEHFLYTALTSLDEKATDQKVKSIIRNIPIIHIYGQLDSLPWQESMGRPYGSRYTARQFKGYRDNIQIIFENMNETTKQNFTKAHEILADAERIYILGFGFHDDNIVRLKLHELDPNKIKGTCHGLSPQIIAAVQSNFKERAFNVKKTPFPLQTDDDDDSIVRLRINNNDIELVPLTIKEFLENHAELD